MAPPAWQDRSVFVVPPPQPAGNGPFWGDESDAATDNRPRRFRTTVARFPIEHPLFCSVLTIATILRVIVALGYPPALWFPDSLPYVQGAMPLATYAIKPMGYSFLLAALEPAHSILLVIALQHIMGLTMGVLVYVLLRHRYRLPSWGATLAAVPALLSAYALQIEHYVLTDTFFALLITIALVLLLWNPVPKVWMCALAGLLVGVSAVVRSQGMLLAVPFVLYLAARARSRRAILGILLMCATLAAPIVAYATWFEQTYGVFELTTSNGAYLYSRVAVFADCAVIKPPADERWLCVSTPPGKRQVAGWYLWAPQSPINHGPGWAFSEKVNNLATNFAIRAIRAQPADYLRVVWDATMQSFTLHTPTQAEYLFPQYTPESLRTLALANQEDPRFGYRYNGGADPNTRLAQPFAGWIVSYQRYYGLPGPAFGAIVLIGLAGVIVAWRRLGGWTLLPWLTGVVLIVTPPATADFDERYLVASVPAFCIAAAIAAKDINVRRHARRQALETHSGNSHSRTAGPDAD
jgi:hypothetical protein